MINQSYRPLLLLDIDGVLNCFDGLFSDAYEEKNFDIFYAEGYKIRMPKGTPERVARLGEVFEMHWGTMWMDKAHAAFASWFNIPDDHPWPWVDFSRMGTDRFKTWKLPPVIEYADRHSDRELVWIDDDIRQDAIDWAQERTRLKARTTIIKPDPSIGLTDHHVDHLVGLYS